MEHVYGIEEYKGIRAIYPPENKTISGGCTSCNGDVKMHVGFIDVVKKEYLCKHCATSSIGSIKLSELLLFSQEKNRKITGKYCRF